MQCNAMQGGKEARELQEAVLGANSAERYRQPSVGRWHKSCGGESAAAPAEPAAKGKKMGENGRKRGGEMGKRKGRNGGKNRGNGETIGKNGRRWGKMGEDGRRWGKMRKVGKNGEKGGKMGKRGGKWEKNVHVPTACWSPAGMLGCSIHYLSMIKKPLNFIS